MGPVGIDNYIIVITILIDPILSHIKAIKPIYKLSRQKRNLFRVSNLKPGIPNVYDLFHIMKTNWNPYTSTKTCFLASRLYSWTMGYANKCWHVPGKNLQVSIHAQPNGIFKYYWGVLQRFPIHCFLQSSIFDCFGRIYFIVSGILNGQCHF